MNNDWAHKMLDMFAGSRMYGKVTFTMSAGHVKHIAREETYIEPGLEASKSRVENGQSYTSTVNCAVGRM